MAGKKSRNFNQNKAYQAQEKRRVRTLQILFVAFSVILILSMLLSMASK
jgi:hypothetical protein